MLSDSEVQRPVFFLIFFPLCQFKIFKMFPTSASVNSKAFHIGFRCDLVHEQTMLSPTSCSQKVFDLFRFLHNFGFSKKWHFANYMTSAGL